jgi:hypothetical protein
VSISLCLSSSPSFRSVASESTSTNISDDNFYLCPAWRDTCRKLEGGSRYPGTWLFWQEFTQPNCQPQVKITILDERPSLLSPPLITQVQGNVSTVQFPLIFQTLPRWCKYFHWPLFKFSTWQSNSLPTEALTDPKACTWLKTSEPQATTAGVALFFLVISGTMSSSIPTVLNNPRYK